MRQLMFLQSCTSATFGTFICRFSYNWMVASLSCDALALVIKAQMDVRWNHWGVTEAVK